MTRTAKGCLTTIAALFVLVGLLLFHPYVKTGDMTPLLTGAAEGNVEAVRREIARGVDVNKPRGTKWTCCQAIILYSENGTGKVYGEDQTALFFAVMSGSAATVEALLSAGAVPLEPEEAESPWVEAMQSSGPEAAEVLKALVRFTGKPPPKPFVWQTFKYAVERGDISMARYLLPQLGSRTTSIDAPSAGPTAKAAVAATDRKLEILYERKLKTFMNDQEYEKLRYDIIADF